VLGSAPPGKPLTQEQRQKQKAKAAAKQRSKATTEKERTLNGKDHWIWWVG
jgi:hypothetical protein